MAEPTPAGRKLAWEVGMAGGWIGGSVERAAIFLEAYLSDFAAAERRMALQEAIEAAVRLQASESFESGHEGPWYDGYNAALARFLQAIRDMNKETKS